MRRLRIVATLAVALGVAACAGMTDRTVLREVQDASVSSTRVLGRVAVVAVDSNAASRKAWEAAFASRLTARGVVATSGDGLPGRAATDADAIVVDGAPVIAAARQAGADAILFVQPPAAAPPAPGHSAYRWFDARSSTDPRTDLDTTPSSVTEVRLYNLATNRGVWRAIVLHYYPKPGATDAPEIAEFVMAGLAKRGYLR
jgi:hypothetical protein